MSARLQDILDDPARRARFVADGAAVVESEVASKRGVSGLAIKAGFRAIQKVRPDMVSDALDGLLPTFAEQLQQHVDRAVASGDIAGWFGAHDAQVTESMLSVTDAKARNAKNKLVQRTYQSLRGQAVTHTRAAMPAVGRLLAHHLSPHQGA